MNKLLLKLLLLFFLLGCASKQERYCKKHRIPEMQCYKAYFYYEQEVNEKPFIR